MDLAIPLAEIGREDIGMAGGKAANLGELLRAGFPVPSGFCVTTSAYRRVVEAAGIAPRLAGLLDDLDVEDPERLAAAGVAAREMVYEAPVPEEVRSALLAQARLLAGESLAVRSSATAEDLPEASFAGQQDTYLNVVGEDALLEAVRRCWASLWTDRAIAYRQRNSIPHESIALAVVVQRMVNSEVAGVLFTANPVSGNRTEITIDASLGLGEAVVSGLVSPDHYVVDKQTLEITSRQVGAKAVQVVGISGGGTARVSTEATASTTQAIGDGTIQDLARLGIEIEAHYSWPQDVEWATSDGDLYILQSRPITSLFPAPPPDPNGALHVYVSLNSAQGMLEPFTPMGISLFLCGIRTVFYGGRPGPIALVDLGGRLYADVTPMLRNPLGRQVLAFLFAQAEPVIGRILSRLLEDPRLAAVGASSRGTALDILRNHPRTVFLVASRVAAGIASPGWARRHVGAVIMPMAAGVRAETQPELAPEEVPLILQRIYRDQLPRLFLNLAPLVAPGIASYRQAEMRVRAWGLDERLLARARQGLPYNMTTTMDLNLWALAQNVKADVPSREAITTRTQSDLAASYHQGSLPPTLQAGIADFLSRYGHRGIREIDLGMPRWGEDPTYLFGILRSYVTLDNPEAEPDTHFARQARAADEAVAELVAGARQLPGGWHKAPLLEFLLGRFRQLGGLRETPKFVLMWMFQAVRQMMLRAGRTLVEQGRLEHPEDVFFLRVEELRKDRSDGLDFRALVAQRRHDYERELARRRAPRVLTSEGQALYGEALSTTEGALAGTGASPGIARGRARIIRDPHGANLAPGEILVAPSTDPAWTPLFLTAGGLVMEAGGMMSHGSIVAREYGIPAVVGVADATTRITDGQMIEIDGYQGLVKLDGLDQPEEPAHQ